MTVINFENITLNKLTMSKNDKEADKLKNENLNKTINEGNSVPNIHPVGKLTENDDASRSSEFEQAGRGGPNEPKKGGRQGGKSVEDGGSDIGSSAGSH
jgi:hypothetical protein